MEFVFFCWSKKYKGHTLFKTKNIERNIDLSKFDIIPDDPLVGPILDKILKIWKGKFVSEVAWSRKPFGLPTNYFSKINKIDADSKNAIKCFMQGKKIKYISRYEINKNADKIRKYKVAVPKAYGASRTLPKNQLFLLSPNEITTETYNVLDVFNMKSKACHFIKYLGTDFVRYLLGIRKLTQDIPKDRWAWVPYMDMRKKWDNESLFKYFNITKFEQEHIKNKVEDWS